MQWMVILLYMMMIQLYMVDKRSAMNETKEEEGAAISVGKVENSTRTRVKVYL